MLSRSSNITCDTSTHNPYCTFRHDPQEPWRLSGVKLCLTVSTRCSTSTSTCALEGELLGVFHRKISPCFKKSASWSSSCSFKIGHRDFDLLDLKKIFLVTNIIIYWSYIYSNICVELWYLWVYVWYDGLWLTSPISINVHGSWYILIVYLHHLWPRHLNVAIERGHRGLIRGHLGKVETRKKRPQPWVERQNVRFKYRIL